MKNMKFERKKLYSYNVHNTYTHYIYIYLFEIAAYNYALFFAAELQIHFVLQRANLNTKKGF